MNVVAGGDLYSLLLASFQFQAQTQGLDVDRVRLVLLDADGQPTTEWDASGQWELYESVKRQFEASIDRADTDITISSEIACDVSGFGTSTTSQSTSVIDDQASSSSSSSSKLFPTTTTNTEWHPPMVATKQGDTP